MEENSIRIIKNNTEETLLDIKKLIAALQKSIEKIVNAMKDHIDEIIECANDSFFSFFHSFWHYMTNGFFRKRKRHKSGCLPLPVIAAAILAPSVSTATTVAFCSFIELIRNVFLLRKQDRGSDDSSSVGYYTYIFLLKV